MNFMHVTHIMCHEFHASDSFKQMTIFIGCYWLKVVVQMTHEKSADLDSMTHYEL